MNTLAAETLYQLAGDIASLDEKTTLVDVCCGTGTIGLCLAAKVGESTETVFRSISYHINSNTIMVTISGEECGGGGHRGRGHQGRQAERGD